MRGSSRNSEQPEHFSASIRQSWSATRAPTSAHLRQPDELNERYPAVPIDRNVGISVQHGECGVGGLGAGGVVLVNIFAVVFMGRKKSLIFRTAVSSIRQTSQRNG